MKKVGALALLVFVLSCTQQDLAGQATASLNEGSIRMFYNSNIDQYYDFSINPPQYGAYGDSNVYAQRLHIPVGSGSPTFMADNLGRIKMLPQGTSFDAVTGGVCAAQVYTDQDYYLIVDTDDVVCMHAGSNYVVLANLGNLYLRYRYLPICGNGAVEASEQCDDANQIDTDACRNTCQNAICGDGVIRTGVEQCDDGNAVDTDMCTASCQAARCGDGVIQTGVEQCDDGNTVDTDVCRNSCVPAICGDGVIQSGVEQCDDSNILDNDGCSAACVAETCTDAIQNQGEAKVDCGGLCAACPTCTDGIKNQNEGDIDCGSACTAENKFCADGLTCLAAGDCVSRVCTAGVCAVPSCIDQVMNGAEKGVDCGLTCNNRCVFPCSFTITAPDVRCPVSSPFDQRVSVAFRTLADAEEFTAEVLKRSAYETYQSFFAYKNGYILQTDGTWQEFAFSFAVPHVDLFDNQNANLVWFDITGTEELAAQAQFNFPLGLIHQSTEGYRYIVAFICGCPVGVDCRIQSLWQCNSFDGGIFTNGAWVVTSVVPD